MMADQKKQAAQKSTGGPAKCYVSELPQRTLKPSAHSSPNLSAHSSPNLSARSSPNLPAHYSLNPSPSPSPTPDVEMAEATAEPDNRASQGDDVSDFTSNALILPDLKALLVVPPLHRWT